MGSIITVEHLFTQFGDQVIHDDLSFSINKGEVFGIVGGSGSGKSILMRFIVGLDPVQRGKILYQKPYSRESVGILFQSGALLSSLSVIENVALPLSTAHDVPIHLAQDIASFKLLQVGLQKQDFHKYPSQLSGGMVKRVGIARALSLDPPILFLDEPTAGLDPIAANDFDELILKIKENFNLTVVMITHDLDTIARLCERIGVLVDKKMHVITRHDLSSVQHPWIHNYFMGERGKRLFSLNQNATANGGVDGTTS